MISYLRCGSHVIMSIFHNKAVAVRWLTAMVVGAGLLIGLPITQHAQQPAQERAVLPFWIMGGSYDSILTLNNTRNNPYPLRLTFYDPAGDVIGSTEVALDPREYRRLTVSELRHRSWKGAVTGSLLPIQLLCREACP